MRSDKGKILPAASVSLLPVSVISHNTEKVRYTNIVSRISKNENNYIHNPYRHSPILAQSWAHHQFDFEYHFYPEVVACSEQG